MKSGHAPSCNLNNLFKASLGCDCTGNRPYPPIDKPGVFANLKAPEPAKVVEFTGPNYRDIANQLRTLADHLELDAASGAGEVTTVACVLIKNGAPAVEVFGVTHDRLHTVGILSAGVALMQAPWTITA